MKKLFLLSIILLIIFSFAACSKEQPGVSQSLTGESIHSSIASVFLFDISGSMSEMVSDGETRLETTVDAAGSLLDVIQTEKSVSGYEDAFRVALLSFSFNATVHQPLTTNLDLVQQGLDELSADGATNLNDGLWQSLQVLASSGADIKQIILLSDGIPTYSDVVVQDESLSGEEKAQQFLQDLSHEIMRTAASLKEQGICIYAVGFGNDLENMSANADLLQAIIEAAGCGAYYSATEANELRGAFIEAWHTAQGEVLFHDGGELTQDNDMVVWTISVPRGQTDLLLSTTWTGAPLEIKLMDPHGQIRREQDADILVDTYNNAQTVNVNNPDHGDWRVVISRSQQASQNTAYNLVLSTRGSSGLAWWIWILIAVLVLGIGTAVLFYLSIKYDWFIPWKLVASGVLGVALVVALILIGFNMLKDRGASVLPTIQPTDSPKNTTQIVQTETVQTSATPQPTATVAPTATSSNEPQGMIVYTCQVDKQVNHDQICIMNADGSQRRQLTNDLSTENFYPSFAPDGESIIFVSSRNGGFEIFEMDLDGSNIQQITSGIGECYAPDISPDGSKIVFTRYAGGKNTISIINRNGGGLRDLNNYFDSKDPIWSPDGSEILFAASPSRVPQFFIMNADGSNVRQITDLEGIRGRSDWSIDGTLASYRGQQPQHNREIFLFGEGESAVDITSGGDNLAPSFSPDGKWITFMSYRDHFWDSDGCEIYVMRLEDGYTLRLTDNGYCDYQPRWSP